MDGPYPLSNLTSLVPYRPFVTNGAVWTKLAVPGDVVPRKSVSIAQRIIATDAKAAEAIDRIGRIENPPRGVR